MRVVARINPLGDEFELYNSSPDVGRDIGSRIEQVRINESVNLGGHYYSDLSEV